MANQCDECGFDWTTSALDGIRLIGLFPDRVESIARGAGDRVNQRPDPDVWSPNEYIWHMVDLFHMFGEWLHMTRTLDHPTHAPLDSDALAAVRGYANRPFSTGLWALRDSIASFIQEAAIADLNSLVEYQGWRDVTAAEVIGFAAHEVAHHAFDLERALQSPGAPAATG